MRRLPIQTLTFLLVAGGPGIAAAAEPSGTAIAVIQSSQAFGQSGNRVLRASAPVYSGDQIVTGAGGQAQIIFKDNTKLVVGPNSRMKIDAFVFSGNSSAKQVSLNAVRGAFRFITGNSAKSAYKITTPTATIGVRGTEFDFNVSSRRLDLAVFNGQTRVCDHRSGTCFTQGSGCSLSQTGAGRNPRVSKAPRAQLDRMFPYIRQQGNLRAAFRVNTSSCGMQRAALPFGGGPGNSRFVDASTVGSVNGPGPTGSGPAPSGSGPAPSGGGSAPSGGGSAPSGGGAPSSGGGGSPSTGGGTGSVGGGGSVAGNHGNGVGGGGGDSPANQGQGNGNGGTAGNSGNAPGHSGASPGKSANSPGHNK